MTDLPSRIRSYAVNGPHLHAAVGSLIDRRLAELRQWYDLMSDEQSRVHEGEVNPRTFIHVGQSRCELLGRAATAAEHAAKTVARGSHLVGGMFHTFQFFELQPRPA